MVKSSRHTTRQLSKSQVACLGSSGDDDDDESKDPNAEEEEDEALDKKPQAIDYASQQREDSDEDVDEDELNEQGGGTEKPAPKAFGPKQLPFAIGGGDDPSDASSESSSSEDSSDDDRDRDEQLAHDL
jgi:hypothetical protein